MIHECKLRSINPRRPRRQSVAKSPKTCDSGVFEAGLAVMIVDAYTHIWESPQQLGRTVENLLPRALGRRQVAASSIAQAELETGAPTASPPQHLAACEHADRTIVVGFKSRYLGANVPNDYVADYVKQHSDRMIGFAGVDPANVREALSDVDQAYHDLGMKGVAIAPAAQDFHPAGSNACRVYEKLNELQLPVLVHQGIYFSARNKLEYGRPVLLDQVARDFPDLKIIIAHMGYPWIDEVVVLLGKHPNVFSDVSGLLTQSWRAYNALLTAYQYGVIDKLLFGSGFPFTSTADSIEALYGVNQMCQGTELPTIPRERLRGIVERPTLTLLGIDPVAEPRDDSSKGSLLDDDE